MKSATLNVRVQFYADDIVRVLKWLPGGTPAKASLVVIQTNLPDLNIHFDEILGVVTLSSGKMNLKLDSHGAIQYLTGDGLTIILQEEELGNNIARVKIAHETNAFSIRQNFKLTPEEGIYGLGQHQSGYMNYRGRTVKLVQANTQAVTPFLVSTAGLRAAVGQLFKNHFQRRPGTHVALVRGGRQH